MSLQLIIFYVFSAIMITASLRVITARNPVHSVLSLVLAFFTMSALWLLMEAEFLAIVLVLVYVGAVMVLFLFVVMMLDINISRMRKGFIRFVPVAAVVAIVMIIELVLIVWPQQYQYDRVAQHAGSTDNTQQLGEILYTDYLLPFEMAAVILLVAIVAAIVLTLRTRPATKYQDPSRQIEVRAQDRIRIVKMKPETRD